MKHLVLITATVLLTPICYAHADNFTITSPAGGTLPSTVSAIGGVVTDLIGLNGARVVAQVAANTEFIGYVPGYPNVSTTPSYLLFAKQSGFTPDLLNALGGGLQAAAFRISLYDGDSQIPDFDHNQDSLYVGANSGSIGQASATSAGVNLGNFSSVVTEETNGVGNSISNNNGYVSGFGNNILDTGFFTTTDSAVLANLYSSLALASAGSGVINFQLRDNTPGDQYFDFTQGIDASLIGVGSGPVVTPPTQNPVPEPSSFLLLATGLSGACTVLRSKKRRDLKKSSS